MAVIEKYKKYAIEEKQVSYNRGVTWEDVTPSETRYGDELGIFDTLEECEDTNCDLEEYRYHLVDGELPTEICGSGTSIEFGIAKRITFTDGRIMCGYVDGATFAMYPSVDPELYIHSLMISNEDRTYKTIEANGSKIENECEWSCCQCCNLCSCFRIDEYMPWVGSTLKVIARTRWTREHCHSEWVQDEDYGDELIGIGERWYPSLNIGGRNIIWQHQLCTGFDGSNPIWVDSGSPFTSEAWFDIPEGAVFAEYSKTSIPFSSNIIACRVATNFTIDDTSNMIGSENEKNILDTDRSSLGNGTGSLVTAYSPSGTTFNTFTFGHTLRKVIIHYRQYINDIPLGQYVSVMTSPANYGGGQYATYYFLRAIAAVNNSSPPASARMKSIAFTMPQSSYGDYLNRLMIPVSYDGTANGQMIDIIPYD